MQVLVTQPCLTLCNRIDCTLLCLSHVNIYTYIYVHIYTHTCICICICIWLSCKESAYNAGDAENMGSIPVLERSPEGGNGSPIQYSCLEKPMDRGTIRIQSMGSQRVRTQLSKHTRIYIHTCTYAVEHCSAKKNETLLFAASSWTWMDLEGIVPREYDCPECLNSYLQRQIRGLLFDIFLFLAPKLSECMASCFPKSASSNPKITPDFPPNHLNFLVHMPEKASHLIDKERLLQIPHLIS